MSVAIVPTLSEVFIDYVRVRKLSDKAAAESRKRLKYLNDWHSLPVTQVTKVMVSQRHEELTARGAATADSVMRVLRALLNFSCAYYDKPDGEPVLARNPTNILTAIKQWNGNTPRKTHIVHSLKPWMKALLTMDDLTRDYFLFLLLTGCRKQEGANLKWKDVHLQHGFVVFKDTKNTTDHELPLSDFLQEMLELRSTFAIGEYVFSGTLPGQRRLSEGQPLSESGRLYERVTELSGVPFTSHWLRRSFATIADSLDIPPYTLKRLLNHLTGTDVTFQYIVKLPDRLKQPMQSVTDRVFELAGISKEEALSVLRFTAEQTSSQFAFRSRTFDEAAIAYLKSSNRSPYSRAEFLRRVRKLDLGPLIVSQITAEDIQRNSLHLSDSFSESTIQNALRAVKTVFRFTGQPYEEFFD